MRGDLTSAPTGLTPRQIAKHTSVSQYVYAILCGMQDWIVETVLLSPLDLGLRLMPSRKRLTRIGSENAYPLAMASNCIVRCQVSVVQQVDASIVGSTRRLLMPGVAITKTCCLLG